ncbi:HIT family protein [Methanobacterium oryzae]|uniref:HIT family protein n=1 Tax=Methanobacterium oryzae TaxID=69540 RepID=UPI003D21716A
MNSEHFEVLKGHNYGDLIGETKHWFILLAPDQKNLGTCVVALNRYEGDLAGLKDEEWQEFSQIVKNLQLALKKSFNTTMFNWGALMNASYLKNPPNPHVHWHFIPRYKKEVEFGGLIFEDPCFGFSTMKSKQGIREIPKNVRMKIIDKLRDNLEIQK